MMINIREKVLHDKKEEINCRRNELSKVLMGESQRHNLAALIGPCALQKGVLHIREGKRIVKMSPDILGIQRAPTWKPRTNDLDWHGLDESDPEVAKHMTTWAVRCGVPRAIEIRDPEHLIEYVPFLTFAWLGARSINNPDLDIALAKTDPELPIGIKNGLDGDFDYAVMRVNRLIEMRRDLSDKPGSVVLIYRGGSDIRNSQEWREKILQLQVLFKGRFIIDVAHGTSMAHDQRFMKSVEGQRGALESIYHLAQKQLITPTGVMVEASDIRITDQNRVTDPNMGLQIAMSYVKDISRVIRRDN